jgi:hypothetical protein
MSLGIWPRVVGLAQLRIQSSALSEAHTDASQKSHESRKLPLKICNGLQPEALGADVDVEEDDG